MENEKKMLLHGTIISLIICIVLSFGGFFNSQILLILNSILTYSITLYMIVYGHKLPW